MNNFMETWIESRLEEVPWLEGVVLGNPAWAWVGAALTVFVVWLVGRVALLALGRALHTDGGRLRHLSSVLLLGRALVASTRDVFLLALGVTAARGWLDLSPTVVRVGSIVVTVVVALQVGLWASAMLRAWLERIVEDHAEEDPARRTSISVLRFLGLVVVWSSVLLLALDNVGVNVSALVAGFGIGGIAVALAAQNILGDLFASLSIILDRPFEVGDFVVVGDFLGVVEKIGLKTTRVTSLGGEQIVFSNTDLLGSRIRNYKKMQRRRVAFSIDVVHGTPTDDLRAVAQIARESVESQENVTFDRAHMKDVLPTALRYEIVYYIGTNDYTAYMDVQQAINLQILEALEERGVRLAHPTYTVQLRDESTERTSAEEA